MLDKGNSNERMKIAILDCYIDEPTCLGVPPYISPYPRYIAGAIWSVDKSIDVRYLTIDDLRKETEKSKTIEEVEILVVIAGMIVPGKYLSTYPAHPKEIRRYLENLAKPIKILCGPAAVFGFGVGGGSKTKELGELFDFVVKGDPEIFIRDFLKEGESVDLDARRESAREIRDFAIKGAAIVKQHQNYPDYLIAEIETYRGCPRSISGGCSFCAEPLKGLPDFRLAEDIVEEIRALYDNGVRHFRIGNQPCIFSYNAKDVGKEEFPRPNPEAVERLFRGIRRVAPNLKTLHIDNANPGVIARYPEESKKIAKIICKYHTPGDVAAFGVESADPKVIKENNLKAYPEDVIKAVEILNEVGSKRGYNGLPELLPGLNFVFGLKGESKETFVRNFNLLKEILDRGLMIRRINLRQVIPLPGTRMYEIGEKIIKKHREIFRRFKKKVREEIDRKMLKRILPLGTVMRDVYTEMHIGKITFARQLGSYPILVGIPGKLDLRKFIDVKVIDYGYRSITAIPYPLEINKIPIETLEAIPGIGRKRALRIARARPISGRKDLLNILDDENIARKLMDLGISFK